MAVAAQSICFEPRIEFLRHPEAQPRLRRVGEAAEAAGNGRTPPHTAAAAAAWLLCPALRKPERHQHQHHRTVAFSLAPRLASTKARVASLQRSAPTAEVSTTGAIEGGTGTRDWEPNAVLASSSPQSGRDSSMLLLPASQAGRGVTAAHPPWRGPNAVSPPAAPPASDQQDADAIAQNTFSPASGRSAQHAEPATASDRWSQQVAVATALAPQSSRDLNTILPASDHSPQQDTNAIALNTFSPASDRSDQHAEPAKPPLSTADRWSQQAAVAVAHVPQDLNTLLPAPDRSDQHAEPAKPPLPASDQWSQQAAVTVAFAPLSSCHLYTGSPHAAPPVPRAQQPAVSHTALQWTRALTQDPPLHTHERQVAPEHETNMSPPPTPDRSTMREPRCGSVPAPADDGSTPGALHPPPASSAGGSGKRAGPRRNRGSKRRTVTASIIDGEQSKYYPDVRKEKRIKLLDRAEVPGEAEGQLAVVPMGTRGALYMDTHHLRPPALLHVALKAPCVNLSAGWPPKPPVLSSPGAAAVPRQVPSGVFARVFGFHWTAPAGTPDERRRQALPTTGEVPAVGGGAARTEREQAGRGRRRRCREKAAAADGVSKPKRQRTVATIQGVKALSLAATLAGASSHEATIQGVKTSSLAATLAGASSHEATIQGVKTSSLTATFDGVRASLHEATTQRVRTSQHAATFQEARRESDQRESPVDQVPVHRCGACCVLRATSPDDGKPAPAPSPDETEGRRAGRRRLGTRRCRAPVGGKASASRCGACDVCCLGRHHAACPWSPLKGGGLAPNLPPGATAADGTDLKLPAGKETPAELDSSLAFCVGTRGCDDSRCRGSAPANHLEPDAVAQLLGLQLEPAPPPPPRKKCRPGYRPGTKLVDLIAELEGNALT
ncbi:hypothetical protein DIPPA_10704 [Diplonema papillatum]|nr:hypothetical protein DIPPA_10704 [Diplonema papillatum]